MRKLLRRLHYWLRHRRHSRDLAEEMEFHRSLRQQHLEQSGMFAADAASASRRALGNTLLAEEDARGVWIWPWLEQLSQDVVYGARILWRWPAFTITTILTLALAIGANTAVFSVVNGVLLKPLPYPNPERLVVMFERNRATGKDRDRVAPPNFEDWKKETAIFDSAAAYRISGFVLSGQGEPEQIRTLSVSASVFRTLGTEAAIGRTFSDDEERKRERVIVLSYEFWRRRFGGDPSIVGRSLNLGPNAFVVTGIMAPQFRFPEDATPVDTYSPLLLQPNTDMRRDAHTLIVVARLKDGITMEAAATHMNGVARRIAAADPVSNPEVALFGIHNVYVEDVRLGLLITLSAVACLLLIASANIANLKLVQAIARRREMALRASLGAWRWRIARQLITESLLLGVLGGTAGLILARWMIGTFRALRPNLVGIENVALDLRVLAFTLAISIAAGLLFGLLPAWQIFGWNINDTIKTAGSTAKKQRAHSVLVAAEVMLSLILIVSAGLMIRSLMNLRVLDYGFRPENLFTIQLFASPPKYLADPDQFRPRRPGVRLELSAQARLFNDLVDRIKASPGIEAAAAVSSLPLSAVGVDFDLPVYVDGQPRPRPDEAPQGDFRIATADYFRAMGIRILHGRGFAETDGPNSPEVVVINETMARRLFGSDNPIGKGLVFYGRPHEIIGVSESVRHRGFRVEPNAEMIVPSRQFHQFGGMTFVLRSNLDSGSLERLIKSELRQIDPDLALSNARTMTALVTDSVAQPRFTAMLLGVFAFLGVVLAAVGMYGVMSYGVTLRTREIGIRMALGAERYYLVKVFVKETLALLAIGLACGLGGAFGAARLMRGLLFGVAPSDPTTYVISAAALILAALAATFRPVLRATHVDPLKALRQD